MLDNGSVSAHHAEIIEVDGVYALRDLGINGTTINGKHVTETCIGDWRRYLVWGRALPF